ncbi:hypothetical protein LIER_40642 [Lithospermum erythrorhizon]|uniref:Uncharacterized protein n=1 Tax=Lithospermum erythrorhizon TaxID=34254 RepID=A0AAV3R051_LITER
MDKKRVVCFVLLFENDKVYGSDSTMSFFAILDDPEQMNQKKTLNSSIEPLLPFTGLKSSFDGCSFASFEDQVYVIGGSTLPWHLQYDSKEIMERVNHKYKDYLKQHSFESLEDLPSNRVLCFEAQKCFDSLFQNNQMEKVEFVELDDVSNHSQTYWGTRPSLTTARKQFHILHLRGKLYAIGGYDDNGKHSGFVINKQYALWYDDSFSCIRLLNLITEAYFIVDLPEHIYRLFREDPEIPDSAKLVDLGEGVLCLIFVGTDLRWEHGVEYGLRDFHYVKFEIIFDHESEGRKAKKSRKSFPGVQLYTRLISHHKFYAPIEEMLGAAFAMDVHVPQKKNLLHTSYFEVDNLKYPLRT